MGAPRGRSGSGKRPTFPQPARHRTVVREVVGYAMAHHHRAELVVDALGMTHDRSGPEDGCLIHSDRGGESTSARFRDRTGTFGPRQSCGRTGSCFDNSPAESFWTLLKEGTGTRTSSDRAPGRPKGFNFIETFCNRHRLRRPLGKVTQDGTRCLRGPSSLCGRCRSRRQALGGVRASPRVRGAARTRPPAPSSAPRPSARGPGGPRC
uniref:Azi39 n=1 Tax=Streptomyces sahachiroi TaxID=285525 RepID=B4XYD1_STREG|nr:Azi39 [Streptomyces sahachiroi]